MKKQILMAAAMTVMLGAGCAKPAAPAPEPSPAESTPEPAPELQDDIYIFYTSDVHCGVDDNLGLPALKAMVDENRAEHAYTFLVDCGVFLQGGTLGSMSRGSTIISLMNRMDYDVVAFGNHEFDYGMDRLKELLGSREFDMAIANGKYTGSGTSVFEGIPP